MSSEYEVYVGFTYGARRHTWRLASAAWVIFTPFGQLMSSRGICLGEATNNVVEYNAVIKLLHDAVSHGISLL
jgi:ribonuclease HI